MALSVNKRPLLRWNLKCSDNGMEVRGVYLTSTNTDTRAPGKDVLYVNKTGSILGTHLIELYDVRCLPHADGMTIKGIQWLNGSVQSTAVRRYYATLVPNRRKSSR